MLLRRSSLLVSSLASLSLVACAPAAATDDAESSDQAFSSREAVQLDFEFDGELFTDSSWGSAQKIQDQFLYTIGHLNADRSVGRLDRLVLTNVVSTPASAGSYHVTYHAKLPVAWGNKSRVPSTYAFTLPRNVSFSGFESFTSKYMTSCVDFGAHEVDSGFMWYYYRPKRSGCALDGADVVTFTASVTTAAGNTTGKYPEYHQVWADGSLDVVAIFGKYEDGATTNDAGISAYNEFVDSMRSTLAPLSLTTEPAALPASPGVAAPDATFRATLPDGKKVTINALLVDNVRTAGAAFDARYASLSTKADLIVYNGHAGLGQNVRALATKGRFVASKYLMLFMNGCDTFAYVDGSLAQQRAALNPDDPGGTKYMDIITNGMPSYFNQDSRASTALVKGLMGFTTPQTYEQMFASVDSQQVVLVTGEEDNVFQPGMPIGGGGATGGGTWAGLDGSGTVARDEETRFETGEVDAGTYTFTLAGTGDADLYVKKGTAPTTSSYDCRPYKNGSAETCTVVLSEKSTVHVMVRGYAASSTFTLAGRR